MQFGVPPCVRLRIHGLSVVRSLYKNFGRRVSICPRSLFMILLHWWFIIHRTMISIGLLGLDLLMFCFVYEYISLVVPKTSTFGYGAPAVVSPVRAGSMTTCLLKLVMGVKASASSISSRERA